MKVIMTRKELLKNWEDVVQFMDDELRKKVESDLGSDGTKKNVLDRYIELDKSFEDFLQQEYGVISQSAYNFLYSNMNDEKREQVHWELAPCDNDEFLSRYLELDPKFVHLLESEFGLSA